MPSNVTKKSIAIDIDLLGPARERSKKFNRRFPGKENLSAYVNELLRLDLGIGVSSKLDPLVLHRSAKAGRRSVKKPGPEADPPTPRT